MIQTPRISSDNTPLSVVFSTLLPTFGYPDETLSLVFDLSHHQDLSVVTFNFKACYKFCDQKLLHFVLRRGVDMKAVFWLGIMFVKQIPPSSSQKSLCSFHISAFWAVL